MRISRFQLACILFFAALLSGYSTAAPAQTPFSILTDFEGSSAKFLSIDPANQTIVFAPGGDRKRGWPCWWWFKVDGITKGSTVTIALDGKAMSGLSPNWAMPKQAAFSIDGGKTWLRTSDGKRDGSRITWKQKIDGTQAQFAWGPPFVPSDSVALVERLAKENDFAQAFELCKTREGRAVPALKLTSPRDKNGSNKLPVIWIQARQHAWESGSSWVCRGFANWICSDDKIAVALREKTEIIIIPIMDIDNTATGNGGKGQVPQDHNRDWQDKPHWPAVAAATKQIKAYGKQGRLSLFVDLHNPGASDQRPYFYTSPMKDLSKLDREKLDQFLLAAKAEITGPLKLSDKHRESGANYDKNWKKISKNWVHANTPEGVVAVTLETSWNTPHSTTEGYQTVGRQLGLAIARFILNPLTKSK